MEKCDPANITYDFKTQQTRLAANTTVVVYTLFVMACAAGFIVYRKKFTNIKETLQVTFNAGGNMSMSLLASTIVSQWTWAANLLGAATAGVQVRSSTSLVITFKLLRFL